MIEQWRPVVGYEGLYEISNTGRLVSLVGRRGPRYEMTAAPSNWGYRRAVLRGRDGSKKAKLLHVLVAEAFIGPRPPDTEVRHLNGNRLDNRRDNLTYGTRSENIADTIQHGRHNNQSKSHCKWGHEFTEENTLLFPNGKWRKCRTCNNTPPSEHPRTGSRQCPKRKVVGSRYNPQPPVVL